MKTWSEFVSLRERCWPGYKPKPGAKAYSPGSCVKEASAAAIAAATAIAKKKSGNYDSEGFRKTDDDLTIAIGEIVREKFGPDWDFNSAI
ncbi:hypothetical protein EBT31_20035 [bacterium]|nr:hypothetical protein [bacterium]